MNITTSYPSQVRQTRLQNRSANIQMLHAPIAQTANNQVNFTGLPKIFKPLIMERKISMNKDDIDFIENAALVLGIDTQKLMDLCRGKTVKRMAFLSSMVEHFNANNWNKPKAQKESGQLVIDLFNRIKKPSDSHINFVTRMNIPMTGIKKCFDTVEDNPKTLDKLLKFNSKLYYTRNADDYTLQILDSPNMQEYLENTEKYISHLEALKEPAGAIKALDKQMASKSLDLVSKKAEKEINGIFLSNPECEQFNKKLLLDSYTPERTKLLSSLLVKTRPTTETLNAGDGKGFIRIYRTTTEKNYDFRTDFLDAHYHNFGERAKMHENEINELAGLLELADKEPKVQKFLTKMSEDSSNVPFSAGDYLRLFKEYGIEYVDSHTSIIKKCIKRSDFKPYEKVIENINKEAEKPVNIILDSIKGLFGIKVKGMPVEDIVKIDSMEKPSVTPLITPILTKKPYIKPEIKAIDLPSEPMIKTAVMPDVVPVEPVAEKKVKPSYRFFKPHVPKQPSAKKLIVINDVNSIIEKKLGSRVFGEQARIYADKATKMRAGMLPEIFASIKETRAAARANGTFSRSKTVSNEDAVDLYTRINGKNKKLVNYLLKVRAEDGTRRYNVKDIIDILRDANKEILRGKDLSTKEHRFTSKDERAIYDRMFEEKLALYGKLPRTSKKSKKA